MFELTIDDEIRIRTLQPDDDAELFALLERNRAHLEPWIHPSALPESARATRIFTIECYFNSMDPLEAIDTPYIDELGRYIPPPYPQMEMGIWQGSELVGSIALSLLGNKETTGEFGYWITKEKEGKGIVTRCVRGLMDYAIEHLKIEEFLIGCAIDNQRSRLIPERLGYLLKETIPQGEVVGEHIYDRLVYWIPSSTWRERTKGRL
jgi:ribosomal-protein-serine acetyltransferase